MKIIKTKLQFKKLFIGKGYVQLKARTLNKKKIYKNQLKIYKSFMTSKREMYFLLFHSKYIIQFFLLIILYSIYNSFL